MTRIIDSWTARDMIAELYGAFDDTGECVPGCACSEPIADEILAPVEDDRWYFNENRAEECDCGHIGPRDERNGNCYDCEMTLAEAEFSDRLDRLRAELRGSRVSPKLLSRFRELLGGREKSITEEETFEKFVLRRLFSLRWRAPLPCRVLWENPQTLADHSELAEAGGQRATIRRDLAVRMTRYKLDVSSPETRFFAPITSESLADLPVNVRVEISAVCRKFDRTTETSVRRVTTAFRRACKPLGNCEIVHHGDDGYIALKWNGKVFCLINCEKDFASRKASTQRSPGCCLMLLKETTEALQREVDYFKKQVQHRLLAALIAILKSCVKQMAKGDLNRSENGSDDADEVGQVKKAKTGKSPPLGYSMVIYYARRFSRPNPYPRSRKYPFPEDHGPMLRHFGPSHPHRP